MVAPPTSCRRSSNTVFQASFRKVAGIDEPVVTAADYNRVVSLLHHRSSPRKDAVLRAGS